MRRFVTLLVIIVWSASGFAMSADAKTIVKSPTHSSTSAAISHTKKLAKSKVKKKVVKVVKKVASKKTASVVAKEIDPADVQSSCKNEGISGVDLAEVRRVWTAWINHERQKVGLDALAQSTTLNSTSSLWAMQSAQKGAITHKRPGQTLYYDYARMVQWFLGLGVAFANEDHSTFSESIGYGRYDCSGKNCTQQLLKSLRSTFNFYMAEKGKKYAPHYNSIMNAHFKEVGVGIAVNPAQHSYYITTHYGTASEFHKPIACL